VRRWGRRWRWGELHVGYWSPGGVRSFSVSYNAVHVNVNVNLFIFSGYTQAQKFMFLGNYIKLNNNDNNNTAFGTRLS